MGYSEYMYQTGLLASLRSIEEQLKVQNKIMVLTEQLKISSISIATYEEKLKELGF